MPHKRYEIYTGGPLDIRNDDKTAENGETVPSSITLPCAVSGAASGATETDTGIGETTVMHSSRSTALIIDDEVLTGGVTAEMMNHFGFETVFLDSPLAALPLLRERRFNIIMIDYMMPKMNGIEFIREHSSLFRGADIFLMTGLDSLDASDIQTDLNVTVLKKPFALKELKRLVQNMMMKTGQQMNGQENV